MNTSDQVDALIRQWKAEGKSKSYIVWNTAMACLAWSYVYSAWGAECTPAERRKRYNLCPSHETIRTKCKAFDNGNCAGCQWFPDGHRTRCYDCRGFTDWCLKQVGFDLYGDTCSSQWNCSTNWKGKGEIKAMPKDTLCCLFVHKNGKWSHTGFGYNNETIECSNGVQYSSKRAAKWSHWAVPYCIESEVIPVNQGIGDAVRDGSPSQGIGEAARDGFPTLRRGSKGEYVTLLQTKLVGKGYSVGYAGIDGDFGSGTEKAVKQFQQDHGLAVDGIVGKMTWKALNEQESNLYTVTIPALPKYRAEALLKDYPGSSMRAERA